MSNQAIHILSQMGVMTSFSVSKRIDENELKKFCSKMKNKGLRKSDAYKIFQEKLASEIHQSIEENKVPGLVNASEVCKENEAENKILKKHPEINRIIVAVASKLIEKNCDKTTLCYFINSLVNMLNLTEDDFDKFHRENSDEDGGENGYKDA